MTDFPRSLIEFQQRFGDKASCAEYLVATRWPNGFVCPGCSGDKAWRLETKAWTYECAGCGRQTSVTAGRRRHQGKMLVVGAFEIEDGGLGPGRIRLNQVSDYSAASLRSFLAANLVPGATAKTDGWSGYPCASGLTHDPHVVGKMAAHIVLPWVHWIFSNVKVWALGVYHGLRGKHLQSYLDEFVFRFNRRRTRHAHSDPCSASPPRSAL